MSATSSRRTIRNPQIGDAVTFLTTAQESGGAYEWVEVCLQPGGGTPLHYHTTFEEEFEALDGRLSLDCDGKTLLLAPGQKAIAPLGSKHRFYNQENAEIVFRVKVLPARSFEKFLRMQYGLARDGRTGANGMPKSMLELAVVIRMGESYLIGPPVWVQKGMFGLLYRIARWRGVERRLLSLYCSEAEEKEGGGERYAEIS
ncbi:cupin domain-containing protein [Cohnella sp. JJ-181]|uniref:cupin domain-containing protein n=1 Tax=Cohnella rhizoplanae TaxID=2974897 RepID=UPI0022FF622C|nr:cupin domain-containing protein [Cohnella sp. JJ-181]CAI6083652.1 hypothetical protein COHCIP112018_04072 [Cohnella sp. JJ-181]